MAWSNSHGDGSDATGDSVGTPTPDAGGGDGGSDAGGDGTPTEGAGFTCDTYAVSGTTAYDLSGTPSLVTFDVPERFEQAGRYPESERFVEEIESPIVEFHQMFVVLDQRYEPLPPGGLQDDIDQEVADQSGAPNPETTIEAQS